MKFYILANGIQRVMISSSVAEDGGGAGGGGGFDEAMKGKKGSPSGGTRRIYHRVVLPVALIFSLLLPFLFVRIAIPGRRLASGELSPEKKKKKIKEMKKKEIFLKNPKTFVLL